MNNKDLVKRNALDKIEKYVRDEIKFLEQNHLPLEEFRINRDKIELTKGELKEVTNILSSLGYNWKIIEYCNINDIESPILKLKS